MPIFRVKTGTDIALCTRKRIGDKINLGTFGIREELRRDPCPNGGLDLLTGKKRS
jgi:hypothetical protein